MRVYIFAFIISFHYSFSQDTIIKYNNDSLFGKVITIEHSIIKYSTDASIKPEKIRKGEVKKIRFNDQRTQLFLPKYLALYNVKEYPTLEFKSTSIHQNFIFTRAGFYFYGGNRYEPEQIIPELSQSPNLEVKSLILASEKAKKRAKIGYLGIPLAACGAAITVVSLAQNGLLGKNDTGYGVAAISCFSLAAFCPIVAIPFKAKQQKSYSNAIYKHNLKLLESEK